MDAQIEFVSDNLKAINESLLRIATALEQITDSIPEITAEGELKVWISK